MYCNYFLGDLLYILEICIIVSFQFKSRLKNYGDMIQREKIIFYYLDFFKQDIIFVEFF